MYAAQDEYLSLLVLRALLGESAGGVGWGGEEGGGGCYLRPYISVTQALQCKVPSDTTSGTL